MTTHVATPQHAEAFLASIVESSEDAIFGMTLDCRIVNWNKAAERMYGYPAPEIIGELAYVLAPSDKLQQMKENLERVKSGERVSRLETVRLRKDGTRIDVSIAVSLLRQADGEPLGMAVIARDLSERKAAREAASKLDRLKTQFLDNISHEIRTPLNGILGMTDLVLDSNLATEQRENLELVKLSAESLISAIDDVMDFPDLETGKVELESIPFDFRESLGETVKMLGFRAHQKGLELVYEVSPEVPEELLGDPGRLRRILYSLMGNAIKFTDSGEVLLLVEGHRTVVDTIDLFFSVKDTGIGIPLDRQKSIFEAFTQADGSLNRPHGGMGLGLSIAKRLVEMAGGKIWVKSGPGQGSTFSFTITAKVADKLRVRAVTFDVNALHGVPILVVDDNSLNRQVLRGTLKRMDMRVTDAPDGRSALQVIRAAKDIGHPFALVLIDSYMKDFDGFSLAEQILKDPLLVGATVMMLTSVGHVGDAARCRKIGIAAYLVKPVRPNELIDAICLALKKSKDDRMPLVTRHSLREVKGQSNRKTEV